MKRARSSIDICPERIADCIAVSAISCVSASSAIDVDGVALARMSTGALKGLEALGDGEFFRWLIFWCRYPLRLKHEEDFERQASDAVKTYCGLCSHSVAPADAL